MDGSIIIYPTKNSVVIRVAKTETLMSYVALAQAAVVKSEVK